MKYVPVPSVTVALAVSRLLYRFTRPTGTQSSDVTQYAIGHVIDVDGVVWLLWDEAFPLPVVKNRGTIPGTALNSLVTQQVVSRSTADAVLALAAENTGSVMTLADVLDTMSEFAEEATDIPPTLPTSDLP
jgi:hypothetical protein